MAAYRLGIETLDQLDRKAVEAKLPKARVIERAISQWYPPAPIPETIAKLRQNFLWDCLRELVHITGANTVPMAILVNASGVSEAVVRDLFGDHCGYDYVRYWE